MTLRLAFAQPSHPCFGAEVPIAAIERTESRTVVHTLLRLQNRILGQRIGGSTVRKSPDQTPLPPVGPLLVAVPVVPLQVVPQPLPRIALQTASPFPQGNLGQ